jgi:hypothetical protein
MHDDALGHQQCRGHFQRHDLSVERIGFGQIRGGMVDGEQQLQQRHIAEFTRLLRQRIQQFAKPREAIGLAGAVLRPHVLDVVEARTRFVEQRLLRLGVATRRRGGRLGNQVFKLQQPLCLAQPRCGHAATGDGVIHIALCRRGIDFCIGRKIAQQEVHAAAYRLDAGNPFGGLRIRHQFDNAVH